MRVSNKSSLKNHLLKTVLPSTQESPGKVVADGGALLWSCNWSKNDKFRTIFQKYVAKCRFLKINIIVFDGYKNQLKMQLMHRDQGNHPKLLRYARTIPAHLIEQNFSITTKTSRVS